MKREEAINTLRKFPIGLMDLGSKEKQDITEAIDMALAALRGPTREQVEKAWGEWIPVMESEITGFNPKFAGRDPICGYKCSRCKAEAVLDCNDEFVLSNFCPTCGAPMTDKAVDIVMKRLEALKDGTI